MAGLSHSSPVIRQLVSERLSIPFNTMNFHISDVNS